MFQTVLSVSFSFDFDTAWRRFLIPLSVLILCRLWSPRSSQASAAVASASARRHLRCLLPCALTCMSQLHESAEHAPEGKQAFTVRWQMAPALEAQVHCKWVGSVVIVRLCSSRGFLHAGVHRTHRSSLAFALGAFRSGASDSIKRQQVQHRGASHACPGSSRSLFDRSLTAVCFSFASGALHSLSCVVLNGFLAPLQSETLPPLGARGVQRQHILPVHLAGLPRHDFDSQRGHVECAPGAPRPAGQASSCLHGLEKHL